jgi:hypothetical protein
LETIMGLLEAGQMETVMHARFTIIIAAALAVTGSAAAEPAKAPVQTAKPVGQAAPVVLASADRVPGSSGPAAAAPVKRPRAARVTSCRCGDPQPQADEQEQQ